MERKNLLIDSDILIDHFEGREPNASLLDKILYGHNCFISVINLYEVSYGIYYQKLSKDEKEDKIKGILQEWEILPLDNAAVLEAASFMVELRKKGKPIEIRDALIGGICLANNLGIVTGNVSHFKRIPGLKVYSARDLAQQLK
ncbi:MAG: type II toxin-antitoxin system VapC family toxin [Candidatus Cloacimonetes bacterium]|nr:type II toxin-antitoxin system VapC family toxin [Candidatus Cloacimonadota bacterium]